MRTVQIKVSERRIDFLKRLLKELGFKPIVLELEQQKADKLLAEIESGLKDVKMMQEGKTPKKTLKEMLNGK